MRLSGKWRIVEIALWDREAMELLGSAFIEFRGDRGRFRFIAVEGTMSCTHASRGGQLSATFTWQGNDECDPASGSGRATLRKDGSLTGHICIHQGDDSEFKAVPFGEEDEPGASGSIARRRGRR